jgi:hypothetical protein
VLLRRSFRSVRGWEFECGTSSEAEESFELCVLDDAAREDTTASKSENSGSHVQHDGTHYVRKGGGCYAVNRAFGEGANLEPDVLIC